MDTVTVHPRVHGHRWVEHIHKRHQEYIIHLLWAEIEFDVKYGIVKRAKLARVEELKDAKGKPSKMAKNYKFTESDEDWLLRQADAAVGNAKARLGWACEKATRFASDELLETPMEYNIVLRFNDCRFLGDAANVMNGVHVYVTKYAIADWLDMEGKQSEAAQMRTEAEASLSMACAEINKVQIHPPKFIL